MTATAPRSQPESTADADESALRMGPGTLLGGTLPGSTFPGICAPQPEPSLAGGRAATSACSIARSIANLAEALDLDPALGTAFEMRLERRGFAIGQLAEDVTGDLVVDVVVHLLVLNVS